MSSNSVHVYRIGRYLPYLLNYLRSAGTDGVHVFGRQFNHRRTIRRTGECRRTTRVRGHHRDHRQRFQSPRVRHGRLRVSRDLQWRWPAAVTVVNVAVAAAAAVSSAEHSLDTDNRRRRHRWRRPSSSHRCSI